MKIHHEIIDLCRAGDRAAQKQLYHELLPYLNAVCRRYTFDTSRVKDILQETFIRIFRNVHQFDASKGEFKSWAVKIAINCCLRQKEKESRFSTIELLPNQHGGKINPVVFRKFSNEEVLNFLKRMPMNYFKVFNLFVIDGFSHKEIADLLQIDETLSRKRLSRARAWIQAKTDENDFFSLMSSIG